MLALPISHYPVLHFPMKSPKMRRFPVAVSYATRTPPASWPVGPKKAPLTLVDALALRSESVLDVMPTVPPSNVAPVIVEPVIVTSATSDTFAVRVTPSERVPFNPESVVVTLLVPKFAAIAEPPVRS